MAQDHHGHPHHGHGPHGQRPHGHSHGIDPKAGDARVAAAIGVNLVLTLVQIVGGVVSGSLALIADAIHNLSDAVSLVIAFAARKLARRPRDGTMTFGYGRAEVVAAMVNYTTLIVISVYLFAEGVARLFNPPQVEGWIVVWIAGVALVVDVVTAALTYAMAKESLNIRAAFLHNLADAFSSVAVIVAGTVILIYDWRLIDPLITMGIAVYILWHALSEVRPVVRILMLGAPSGLDSAAVATAISEVAGVDSTHHVHLWQIDETRVSVEAHLVTQGPAPEVLARVKTMLKDRFGVTHSTLEVEAPGAGCATSD